MRSGTLVFGGKAGEKDSITKTRCPGIAGFDELESRRAPGLQQFHGTKSSGLDIMRALVHVGECE
jgi:hypothetical protein